MKKTISLSKAFKDFFLIEDTSYVKRDYIVQKNLLNATLDYYFKRMPDDCIKILQHEKASRLISSDLLNYLLKNFSTLNETEVKNVKSLIKALLSSPKNLRDSFCKSSNPAMTHVSISEALAEIVSEYASKDSKVAALILSLLKDETIDNPPKLEISQAFTKYHTMHKTISSTKSELLFRSALIISHYFNENKRTKPQAKFNQKNDNAHYTNTKLKLANNKIKQLMIIINNQKSKLDLLNNELAEADAQITTLNATIKKQSHSSLHIKMHNLKKDISDQYGLNES